MPVTRFGGSEEEKLTEVTKTQVERLGALSTNRAIADAIMTEITGRYGSTDLNTKLINPKAIHVSFSWG